MATDTPAPAATDPAPVAAEQRVQTERAPRRTVTLPVLPLVIIGAVLVALVFFGGGVAIGAMIGDHGPRLGTVQPFGGLNGQNRQNGLPGQNGFGPQGGQHGFGQNRQNGLPGQNGNVPPRPSNRPSGAPQNG